MIHHRISIAAILLLPLTGCYQPPDFTYRGLAVYADGLASKQGVRDIVDRTLEINGTTDPWHDFPARAFLEHWRQMDCWAVKDSADCVHAQDVYVAVPGDVRDSALQHALTHSILLRTRDDFDYNHALPVWQEVRP